jgi:hypothetical protein
MKNQTDITKIILALEKKLLDPEVRNSAEKLAVLLADDFAEFGKSGRIYNKAQVITGLQKEHKARYLIVDFKIRILAEGVVLATYTAEFTGAEGNKIASLRSSIWKLIDGMWRIIFHQGTITQHRFVKRAATLPPPAKL